MGKYGKGDTGWFTHDRFGMFIVWGLYSMAARHEWVRNFEQMSDDEYQGQGRQGGWHDVFRHHDETP